MPCAVPEEKQQDGYMSAPEEEQQVVDADRVDHAASYMEMTVPLLHEAMPARTLLADMSRPRKPQVRTRPSHARACAAEMSAKGQGWAVSGGSPLGHWRGPLSLLAVIPCASDITC